MTQPENRPALDRSARPEHFTATSYDKLRYGDTDRQGHVNNAVYATFFETGRCEFMYDAEGDFPPAGHDFVTAQVTITYVAEILWPGEVQICSRVGRIGNSSFTVEQAVFEGGELKALAEVVEVMTNNETRRSAALPEHVRSRLGELQTA